MQSNIDGLVRDDEVAYFAYGANLSSERVADRVRTARFLDAGSVPGYRMAFDLPAKDGSAKCNIHATGHDADLLHGACYALATDEMAVMTGIESGYDLGPVNVTLRGGETLRALAYFGRNTVKDLLPFDWYKAQVLQGAREIRLPNHVISAIDARSATPDTNLARATQEFSIVDRSNAKGAADDLRLSNMSVHRQA